MADMATIDRATAAFKAAGAAAEKQVAAQKVVPVADAAAGEAAEEAQSSAGFDGLDLPVVLSSLPNLSPSQSHPQMQQRTASASSTTRLLSTPSCIWRRTQ